MAQSQDYPGAYSQDTTAHDQAEHNKGFDATAHVDQHFIKQGGFKALAVNCREANAHQTDGAAACHRRPGFGGQKFIPSTLEKVRKLATMRTARGLNFRIEIDGGIDLETIGAAVKAGVEIFVAGNAVFGHGDPAANVEELLRAAHDATMIRA